MTRRYRSLRSDAAKRDVEDHVGRVVAALEEGVDDLQALDGLLALLLLGSVGGDDLAELLGLGLEVDAAQELADGLGAHAALEVDAVVATELGEEALVGDELALLELHELLVGLGAQALLVLVLGLEVGDAGANLVLGEGLDVAELPCSRRRAIWSSRSASSSSRSASSSSLRSAASASRASESTLVIM